MGNRINKVSTARSRQMREYRIKRLEFLKEHPYCEVCAEIPYLPTLHKHMATEIHHTRGRIGSLLCDSRYWKAACIWGHWWIGTHPIQARQLELICHVGEWNQTEKLEQQKERNART